MEHHENNGHGNSHDDHATEGNRQYYPKGWWVPLIGLLIVALGFTALGTFVLSHSGTDRWGKTEQCEMKDGKCCDDPNCKGDKCKNEGKECKDEGGCKDGKDSKKMDQRDPIYRNRTSVGW
ncbi:MAG TPA: hypothetical protein VFJ43_05480 [Bacteroidia bacterium]|nr:hypothetical protein [Bacteroidia bacterium]